MRELVIAADDRTGALEVAGECAAVDGRPVHVVPFEVEVPDGMVRVVVDLGSRHLSAADAAARAGATAARTSARRAHKIDSALRGNWAVELAARLAVGDGPAVVVACLPAVGRICRDGIVGEIGAEGSLIPIDEVLADDGRGAPVSGHPAEHLRAAGVDEVVEVPSASALASWLLDADDRGVAVIDAATPDDLREAGRLVAGAGALLAGTAAAIAAWHGDGATATISRPVERARVLVVCGTLDGGARRQLDVLLGTALPITGVVVSPDDVATPVPEDAAEAMAGQLARETWQAIDRDRPDVVVVLGGDTTAAVLGSAAPMLVTGRVEAGTALSRRADGTGPWFVTRSGSFGEDGALRDLVDTLVGSSSAAGERGPR